jgi:hypothetical protein
MVVKRCLEFTLVQFIKKGEEKFRLTDRRKPIYYDIFKLREVCDKFNVFINMLKVK